MQHDLKIEPEYMMQIIEGKKLFEVRKNDRDFQVGDTICFSPKETDRFNIFNFTVSPLPMYEVVYIHTGLGMRDGYCVLSIKVVDYEN